MDGVLAQSARTDHGERPTSGEPGLHPSHRCVGAQSRATEGSGIERVNTSERDHVAPMGNENVLRETTVDM
jgi:hypothetical protein